VYDLARAVARVRSVDCELPRSERAEALNQMLRYGRVVWVVATIPAPRSNPLKRRVDTCDPSLLRSAGVAYEAVFEQRREALAERVCQGLDELRVRNIDIDHREVAVELQARRGERAAIPCQHLSLIDGMLRPAFLDWPLAIVQQGLK